MTPTFLERTPSTDPLGAPTQADVIELSLLLPGCQLEALENAARDRGLTIGQMIRRLIGAFLHEPA